MLIVIIEEEMHYSRTTIAVCMCIFCCCAIVDICANIEVVIDTLCVCVIVVSPMASGLFKSINRY